MFLIIVTLVVLANNHVNCKDVKKRVVFCNEKFTKKTNIDYTNYTGCLIEKSSTKKPTLFVKKGKNINDL